MKRAWLSLAQNIPYCIQFETPLQLWLSSKIKMPYLRMFHAIGHFIRFYVNFCRLSGNYSKPQPQNQPANAPEAVAFKVSPTDTLSSSMYLDDPPPDTKPLSTVVPDPV